MFAIIETGGKQYKVAPGDKLKVEKLETGDGEIVVFDKVLFKGDGKNAEIGSPYILGSKVEAKVAGSGRSRKKIVFKYSSKTRRRVKNTHRQYYTEVEITKIS
ncbi:MAG: 50S ribosomal protein L21 [Candidatus Jorgensenbacteria bacterium]